MDYNKELAKFKSYLESRVQPGTANAYIYALKQWFNQLNGNDASHKAAQRYVDLLAKTKSPSTANLRGHAIMRYFKWKGTPASLDCPTIRFGDIEYLTMDQLNKVLAACKTVLEWTLVTVLFDSAVRISELLNIELDDIDWNQGFISVVRKGGRREEVNISDKGLEALRSWLDARESKSKRVFMDLDYYGAWCIIRGIGKRANIKLHPHMLRHSRAVQMRMAGANMEDIKEHLGHRNLATTVNIYSRLKAVDLKRKIPDW